MKDFDLITFDCYGTLIDWETGIYEAFRKEAVRDGLALERSQVIAAYAAAETEMERGEIVSYRQTLGRAAMRSGSQLGWPLTQQQAILLARSLPSWRPFPDTNRALERLASRFHLGILFNVDDDLLLETLEHFTVSFEMIVTAEQVRSYKPGRAHFEEANRRPCGIANSKFQIKLYRTRGLNPRVRPKGRASASPLWKPHRLCARLKRRGLH